MARNDILEAVIAKAHAADEATLISMLEARSQKREELELSQEDMAELEHRRQRRIDGEQGSTLEEIVGRINVRRANGRI